jgi:hypothetical protein
METFLQGYPMIDFFVREVRAVVTGDLIIIRFATTTFSD